MKPRLTFEYSITKRCKQWFCRGGGILGMSDTPKEAYKIWQYTVAYRGAIL